MTERTVDELISKKLNNDKLLKFSAELLLRDFIFYNSNNLDQTTIDLLQKRRMELRNEYLEIDD